MDCGAGHVACAAFTRGARRRLQLRHFASEVLDPNPASSASWIESLGRVLPRLAGHGAVRGACRLTLPGHHTLTKFVRTPAVGPERRSRIAEFEAQQGIPCPLAEMVWDHLCVAADGTDLQLMLAAAKRTVVEPTCAVMTTAGFVAEQIIPGSLALARAFHHNYPEVADGVLVLNIGARSTQIVALEGGHFFSRTVAVGGNSLTQAVAEELRVEFAVAELLKRQVLEAAPLATDKSATADVVRGASARFLARLHVEIVRSIAHCRPDGSAARPAIVYLTGGGSLVPGVVGLLAAKLDARVERYDVLRNLEVMAPELAEGMALRGSVTPELIGLAIGPGPDEPPGFNLLPPELVHRRRVRQRQPYLLAAAMAAVAALLPLIWHFQRAAVLSDQDSAALEKDLIPLRALVARNVGNLARLEHAKARIAALGAVVKMKSSWINFLADLQGRLVEVEDVWLEKLEILPPTTTSKPTVGSPPPLRLALSGRLLDWNNPVSKVSPDSYERAQRLLRRFGESEFVSAVENEQFDNTQPGILRFDCVLVINPRKPL